MDRSLRGDRECPRSSRDAHHGADAERCEGLGWLSAEVHGSAALASRREEVESFVVAHRMVLLRDFDGAARSPPSSGSASSAGSGGSEAPWQNIRIDISILMLGQGAR